MRNRLRLQRNERARERDRAKDKRQRERGIRRDMSEFVCRRLRCAAAMCAASSCTHPATIREVRTPQCARVYGKGGAMMAGLARRSILCWSYRIYHRRGRVTSRRIVLSNPARSARHAEGCVCIELKRGMGLRDEQACLPMHNARPPAGVPPSQLILARDPLKAIREANASKSATGYIHIHIYIETEKRGVQGVFPMSP